MLESEIRRRRKELGWSQEKLGEMTDLSQKQISKIETQGTHDVRKLKHLADVFGMMVDELIDDGQFARRKNILVLYDMS